MTTTQPGPLTGVRVLELAALGPASFTAMVLADLGAEVIRIDRPGPPRLHETKEMTGLQAKNDVLNRGRTSLTIDLKSPTGARELLREIEGADVLIEAFRPGVTERLGIGPDVALEANPGLVYCRLTGWGQEGPQNLAAGHDINYLALSGLLDAFRGPGTEPHPPLNLLGDFAGGGLLAVLGVVAALFERSTSGKGQVVDAAMVDGIALIAARLMSLRTMPSWDGDNPGTNLMDGGAPFYATYLTSDDRYIAVGALEPKFYREFVTRITDESESWPDQADRDSWPRLRQLIAEAFRRHDLAHWTAVFDGTDACVTPVLTFDEAVDHPHNVARGTLIRRNDGIEPSIAPRFSRTPGSLPQSADRETSR